MLDSLKTTLYASLGAVSMAQEKLKETIDELVEKGELTHEQGAKVVDSLADTGECGGREIAERFGEEVGRLINRTPLASRRAVEDLERRVTAIEGKLELIATAFPAVAADGGAESDEGA